jgi:predicted transposase YbfD/YdcC
MCAPHSFAAHLADLPDPRVDRTKLYDLLDILVIVLCAVISGAEGWTDIAQYGRTKEAWLRTFLALPNGVPTDDTFARVFARLDSEAFGRCFARWTASIKKTTRGKVVSIDGKSLRHSFDTATGKAAIQMVSAWANESCLVLAQQKVDVKSNEITAIPKLLELLELEGCIVTIDAMGTQKDIARQIISNKADYVLALKLNQGHAHEEVSHFFETGLRKGFGEIKVHTHETIDYAHGRVEKRRCFQTDQIDWLLAKDDWEGLTSIGMVQTERTHKGETRYFLSSLPGKARLFAKAVREHWGIENSLHWQLDISFDEDRSRIRKDKAPENLATVRHIALNMLQQNKTLKRGVKAKRLQAAWDNDYLVAVLTGDN